ncbi:MAG: hypothetical protein PHQ04_09995 [Opitutaceae bacterium]|nr:hypothetical protein [Opitutaceae bacterium]
MGLFFENGDDNHEVASWVPDGSGDYVVLHESLGSLYGASGSTFAARHRDTLLAHMVPALSLATGQHAVGAFTPPNAPPRNFNLNSLQTGWPAERQGSDTTRNLWLHSDLREVAYLYTHKLPETIVALGGLKQ